MIILKNGILIEPGTNFMGKRDVAIEGKNIAKIAENILISEDDTVYDCTDKYIGPGLVDVHVHFRDPGFTYKEDILTLQRANALADIKFDDDYFDYFYEKCFDKKEFVSRFGITIIMNNFLDEKYLNRIFEMCEKVKSDAYYVKMAIAWLLSFCFMKFRDRTLEYLKANTLDKFTHNKAIAKCRDSYQVSADDKEFLKTLRK